MGVIVLVTGGARSGKSAFAEQLAISRGDPVTYVATAEALDTEMEDRIAHHQARRPSSWTTREAPHRLLDGLRGLDETTKLVLVDCLSLWTSNRLLELDEPGTGQWWEEVRRLEAGLIGEIEELIRVATASPWDLILVSNEVGAGVVPQSVLGRAFRDLLGRVNAAAGVAAHAVFLVTAGLAVDIKPLAVVPRDWQWP